MPQSFEFSVPTRILFGPGVTDRVGLEAAQVGSRALVVTGSAFAQRSGIVGRVTDAVTAAGLSSVLSAIPQNPTVDDIDAAAVAARAERADLVIGVGGGSALDAAKAIAAAVALDRPVWDTVGAGAGGKSAPIGSALPLLQVPIIASTGSESNHTAVLMHPSSRTRAPVSSQHLYARVALVDPALTLSVPSRYTAVGGINIISQLLEQYLTSDEFAARDRVTEGMVRVVLDSLSRALLHGDDLDARTNLSWTATMASSLALTGTSGSAPLRALAYALTARFPIEHGAALAALWPSYMRYVLANRLRLPQLGRFKRYALLGRQLFGVHETDDEVAAETASYRFASWLRGVDMPTGLRSLDLEPEVVHELAQRVVRVSGNGLHLPGGLSVEDVEHIYDGALRT